MSTGAPSTPPSPAVRNHRIAVRLALESVSALNRIPQSWQTLIDEAPATMVDAAPDGTLYAFVMGRGLVSAKEAVFDFGTVSSGWGERFILHFAVDPTNPLRLFAATGANEVLMSTDAGNTWALFGGQE